MFIEKPNKEILKVPFDAQIKYCLYTHFHFLKQSSLILKGMIGPKSVRFHFLTELFQKKTGQ